MGKQTHRGGVEEDREKSDRQKLCIEMQQLIM